MRRAKQSLAENYDVILAILFVVLMNGIGGMLD